MRRKVVSSSVVAAMVGLLACRGATRAPEQPLAAEGRGLLPQPPDTTIPFGESTAQRPFVRDASGMLSRTLFETDEHPTLKITVRDFSFAPGAGPKTLTLRSAAFIRLVSDHGAITIGNERTTTNGQTIAVSAGSRIEVVNDGEQHVVVRAFIVEAK